VVTRSSCRLALILRDLRNGLVGYLVRLGRAEFSAGDHITGDLLAADTLLDELVRRLRQQVLEFGVKLQRGVGVGRRKRNMRWK
jgi:hypothetical protein